MISLFFRQKDLSFLSPSSSSAQTHGKILFSIKGFSKDIKL